MTMDEARQNTGKRVVYRPFGHSQDVEGGEIVVVGETYVFVRYDNGHVKATPAADLTLEEGP